MQKLMKRFHKNQKGFTLVELMVVVVIIGILVAIAIPLYGAVQTNAANRAHDANVRTLIGAANMYMADGVPSVALTDVDLSAYIDGWKIQVPNNASGAAEYGDPTDSGGNNYEVDIAIGGIITVRDTTPINFIN